MNRNEIIELLESKKNDRYARYDRNDSSKIIFYGLGLTALKKMAKEIGKQHELAKELFNDDIYEVQTLGVLLADPKLTTREQVEEQLPRLIHWGMSHAYCSVLLAKVKFQQELAEEWIASSDDLKRRCGFACMYNIAKDNKKLEDAYFVPYVEMIENELQDSENFVRDAMNNALWMIGQRSVALNKMCIATARKIGKVEVDYGDNSCEPVDVIRHLTGDRIQAKLQKLG